MTIFEENARMASVEISGNPEIKMRYHPNLNKQMAAKNLIEPQSSQQPHKIGQSTSLVKWRHKSSEEVCLINLTRLSFKRSNTSLSP